MDNNLENQIVKHKFSLVSIIVGVAIVLPVVFWVVVDWSLLISFMVSYRTLVPSAITHLDILKICALTTIHSAVLLYIMRIWLERIRGFVVVEADFIVISDWRGKQTKLPWNAIDKVCIASYGGFVKQPDICIKSGTSLTISGWIERSPELRDTIISRANLNKVETKWWRTCYIR